MGHPEGKIIVISKQNKCHWETYPRSHDSKSVSWFNLSTKPQGVDLEKNKKIICPIFIPIISRYMIQYRTYRKQFRRYRIRIKKFIKAYSC